MGPIKLQRKITSDDLVDAQNRCGVHDYPRYGETKSEQWRLESYWYEGYLDAANATNNIGNIPNDSRTAYKLGALAACRDWLDECGPWSAPDDVSLFEDLPVNSRFAIDTDYFVKIAEQEEEEFPQNAVNLRTGEPAWVPLKREVSVVKEILSIKFDQGLNNP